MDGSNFLADTNFLVDFIRGTPKAIEKMAKIQVLHIPSIVLGELYFGAERSNNPEKNRRKINQLSVLSNILDCDGSTAENYGMIKSKLFKNGKPLPENDIWIAAIALQYGLEIITRDRHFDEIEDVVHSEW
jgi:tRNA(fMet)-specific endonuclease VapC